MARRGSGSPREPATPEPDQPATEPKFRGWLHFKQNFPDGRSVFEKEFSKLPPAIRAGYDELKARVVAGTAREGSVKHIGEGIYELKNRQSNNPYRLLYMKWEGYLVALTVFHKKDEKTDKSVALVRKKRWMELSKGWAKPRP